MSNAVRGNAGKLAVSACLFGERVRFNAGRKRDTLLVDVLGRFAVWDSVDIS